MNLIHNLLVLFAIAGIIAAVFGGYAIIEDWIKREAD